MAFAQIAQANQDLAQAPVAHRRLLFVYRFVKLLLGDHALFDKGLPEEAIRLLLHGPNLTFSAPSMYQTCPDLVNVNSAR